MMTAKEKQFEKDYGIEAYNQGYELTKELGLNLIFSKTFMLGITVCKP
ncbi:hypothetical protein [Maribacter sp. 2304DJ31-5]